MKKINELLNNYKIQIIVIAIIILLIPIISITVNKLNKYYRVERVNKERYFVLISKEKSGVIDEKGEIIIEPKYYKVSIPNPSRDIFVCYYDYNEESGTFKTKVINSKGTELFTKYNDIDVVNLNGIETTIPYEKNLLKYKENDKFGLIDLSGNIITDAKYDDIEGLISKEGELLVKKDDKFGVINNRGKELIKIKYDYIAGDEYYRADDGYKSSGYIIGEKKDNGYRYGYMNKNQKLLLGTDYNEITRIGDIKNENTDKNVFVIARKNGQCGLIKNKKVIIDFKYQEINYSGVENLFILTRNTKSGVYTSKGKKILPVKFEDIAINDDYIYSKNGDTEKYYNFKGQEVDKKISDKEVEDDQYSESKSVDSIKPSLIPNNKNGKWGFIDKNENVKVDYIYDEVTEVNKYGFAGIKKDGKWGSIDEKGNIVQEPIYDLDEIEEISFIGKYYKVIYDYKDVVYTDNIEK